MGTMWGNGGCFAFLVLVVVSVAGLFGQRADWLTWAGLGLMHTVVSACGTVTCLIGCPLGVVGSPRALVLTWLIQWLTCQPRTMYDSRVGLRYQGSRQAAVVSRMPKAACGLWAVVDTSTSA